MGNSTALGVEQSVSHHRSGSRGVYRGRMATTHRPPTQAVAPGVPMRFAVGAAGGRRSQVWSVCCAVGRPDVLIGIGTDEPSLRLSQRRGGWRLEYLPARGLRTRRGRISEWAWPERGDGCWRRALSIVVPTTSLLPAGRADAVDSPDVAGVPDGPRPDVAFWPAPPVGSLTQFDLLFGTPGHWGLSREIAGEVGRSALSGPGALWVVAHHPELSADGLTDLARRHAAVRDAHVVPPRTWVPAVAASNGQVVLFDFSHDDPWWDRVLPP